MFTSLIRFLIVSAFFLLPPLSFAQVRIVTYNTNGGPRADSATVFNAINSDTANGIARPIDILLLQESTSVETTTQAFADLLNGLPGTDSQTYVRGNLNGGTTGGGRPTVVYNSAVVQLVEESAFGTTGTSAQARQTLRYRFRPVGYSSDADFYVYNNHYKAGNTGTDRTRRNVEASAIRTNVDSLGEGTSAIFVGDFNVYTNLEPMWTTLRAAGAGQAFDPLNREGIWSGSAAFRDIHTQSPTTTARFSGQTTGGMDDRFDFQLSTAEVQDGEGFAIIPNTYRAFGNNGTHPLNGNIDDPSNTAEPLATLTAIANASDHLPVIADYQLPAKMLVTTGAAPSRVIEGASLSIPVTVANTAPVQVSKGADELDYSGSSTGSLAGVFSGTDEALGGGNVETVSLVTSSVGSKSGTLNVVSSSQSAANPSFETTFLFDVLAHSNASFQHNTDVDSLTIDFGIVARHVNAPSRTFAIFNLLSLLGVTADLDLDQILPSGQVNAFNTNWQTFTGLDAGQSHTFTASLSTMNLGVFNAAYSFVVSDENLPGATTGTSLALSLHGRVATGGDANLDGSVTAGDFAALQISINGSGNWTNGDFNGDELVTAADFAILQQNFGLGPAFSPQALVSSFDSSLSAAAVPEADGSLLIFIASVATAGASLWQRLKAVWGW